MNRSIFLSLIVLFAATSCATLKKSVLQPDQLVLTKENIKELDGTYKLDRIDSDTLPRNIDDLSWILLVHGNTEHGDQIQLK